MADDRSFTFRLREAANKVWPGVREALLSKLGPTQLWEHDRTDDWSVTFQIRTDDERLLYIAEFTLSKMPGTRWLYSSGAEVATEWRNNGVGGEMNSFRKLIAQAMGSWGLLAFVACDNDVQKRLLQRQGWECLRCVYIMPARYAQEIWVYVTDNFGVRQ